MMGGGYTPVHTTFVPPLALLGAGKHRREQENINPSLNAPPPPYVRVPSPPIMNPSPFAPAPKANAKLNHPAAGGVGGFDAFADMNPFTLKTLDAYRMQLWGKMAAQNHLYQQQQQQREKEAGQRELSGLVQQLRPSFFRDAQHPSLSGSLSGKASLSSSLSYPTPPSSPPALYKGEKDAQRDAMYAAAALASQTLLGKLGSAFWDAFSGGPSPSSPLTPSTTLGAGKQWDADKVRRVLEGKAVVRVVDIEGPVVKKSGPPASPVLASAPAPTSTSKESSPRMGGCGGGCDVVAAKVSDILEESMRSLSLGKK